MSKDEIETAGSFLVLVKNFPQYAALMGNISSEILIADRIYRKRQEASRAEVILLCKATVTLTNILDAMKKSPSRF